MSQAGGFDGLQRRHALLGLPIATIYTFVEEEGLYLAAVIACYGMFSLFPLLLLLSSAVGFFLEGNPALQERIIEVAVEQVPTLSESFVRTQLSGSPLSFAIGAFGALFGALAVGTAVQNAMNAVWHVPVINRPNPLLIRVRSVGILLVLLVFVLITTFVTQIDPRVLGLTLPPALHQWLGHLISFVVATLTFTFITKVAVKEYVPFAKRLPGAVCGALFWQLLQSVGAAYVQGYVANSTIANGVFGSLLGVLLWIFLAGVILVMSCVFNVVVIERFYPRSLRVLFVDNADLTEADRRLFARRAAAQRFKSHQRIDVRFDAPPAMEDGLAEPPTFGEMEDYAPAYPAGDGAPHASEVGDLARPADGAPPRPPREVRGSHRAPT